MSRDTGGPAFPRDHGDDGGWASAPSGMSLRDYFAGQALNAIGPHAREDCTDEQLAALYAREAYLVADAMLTERAKGGEPA